MRRTFLYSFVILFFAFMPQKKMKVIFFGDSITEFGVRPGGYITRIESLCKADNKRGMYDFIGAGVSGNKVYDLYLRLEEDVLKKKPDIVVVFIGVNDIWHKALTHTGTDPDKFEIFYQAIINKLKVAGSKIVLCTPASIGEKTDFSNPQDADLNRYSSIIRSLASKNKIQIVDLRKLFLAYNLINNPTNKKEGILTEDGVHLNANGNELVAKEMWKMIRSL
ncbi:MAG: G-D-S-L family lipolytic protein [Bacteroidetes bacterium]|nr:G-D-S-L family lipolytic protein [Bacteroidota bacterium]MBS1633738.1 G-D-S-L family lipolytic protein [Bacteroidota bacterium]